MKIRNKSKAVRYTKDTNCGFLCAAWFVEISSANGEFVFSLIITIISVVLAGLLVMGTLMYLNGDSLSDYGSRARSTGLLNQASHIKAANSMYYADTSENAESLELLVQENYLQSHILSISNGAPVDWSIAGDFVYAAVTDELTCRQVNQDLGLIDPVTGQGALPSCLEFENQGSSLDSVCCVPQAATN